MWDDNNNQCMHVIKLAFSIYIFQWTKLCFKYSGNYWGFPGNSRTLYQKDPWPFVIPSNSHPGFTKKLISADQKETVARFSCVPI